MDQKNSDFIRKLLSTFKIEAAEHIQAISSGLLELEKAPKAEFQQPIEEVKIWNEGHLKVHKAEGQQPLAEEKLTPAETVRISTAKLGSLLLQTEELLSAKVAASQRAAELKEIKTAFG